MRSLFCNGVKNVFVRYGYGSLLYLEGFKLLGVLNFVDWL